jgi:methionine biosynthesis protein MetW
MELLDDRQRKLINIVKEFTSKGGKLLDIGCADGRLTFEFKKAIQADEVYGIDVVENYLKASLEKGIKINKVNVNEDKFPFSDNYFDTVIASEIIEHCIVPENLLREVYRVLKPEGYFILSTPNLASYFDRFMLLIGSQPLALEASFEFPSVGEIRKFAFSSANKSRESYSGDPGHIRCMSYKTTIQFIELLKFYICKTASYSWSHSSVKPYIRPFTLAIDNFFRWIPGFASGYIYICKKTGDNLYKA